MCSIDDALTAGDFKTARATITRGGIEQEKASAYPVLPEAVSLGYEYPALRKFIAWMLDKGIDPDASWKGRGRTALMEASICERLDIVKLLLSKGASVACADADGSTALHLAACSEITALLIKHGADVNTTNAKGHTPLALARDAETVRLLIEAGADVNARCQAGRTPIYSALLKLKLRPDLRTEIENVELLLGAGAEVNVEDKDGVTPLHAAAAVGIRKPLEILVAKGARTETKTRKRVSLSMVPIPRGRTPLGVLKEEEVCAEDDAIEFLEQASATGTKTRAVASSDDPRQIIVDLRSERGLRAAILAMTKVVKQADQHANEDGMLPFDLADQRGPTSEANLFRKAVAHPGLHAKVAAYVREVIRQNTAGERTLYANEELEVGSEAMSALLSVKAKGALRLYEKFLSSIDLDHTVEQHAVVARLMRTNKPNELTRLVDLLSDSALADSVKKSAKKKVAKKKVAKKKVAKKKVAKKKRR